MLEHGGRLRRAAQRHGIALQDWLDLSTGISPWSWLADNPQAIPVSAWSRLPEDDDDLADAARSCYGARALPLAGSQAAIQLLPRLRAPCRVGLLRPSYAEHEHHWRLAGHSVRSLRASDCEAAVDQLDVLVLVQPNNPDGRRFPRSVLLDYHRRLAARGGWLVVDEAFGDATPEASLAPDSAQPGLMVLRSLGKFYGLAGARVGFLLAAEPLRAAMREALGPWALAGPSRLIAAAALRDSAWQARQALRLREASQRLAALLRESGLPPLGGCELFQWVRTPLAAELHDQLAARGVLTRLFDESAPATDAAATPRRSLRLGLPATPAEEQRLRAALHAVARAAA